VLDDFARVREEKQTAPPTVAELRENLLERVEIALSGLQFTNPAQILRKQIVTETAAPMEIRIIYLSDEKIDAERKRELAEKIRRDLNFEDATVNFERVPVKIGEMNFSRNQSALSVSGMLLLDFAGRTMRENPSLILEMTKNPRKGEREEVSAARIKAVADFLETRWQIPPEKIKGIDGAATAVRLTFATDDGQKETETALKQ
jgi:hypothetical protein